MVSLAAEAVELRLGGSVVLDRVSVRVCPGEVLAVVGPNGSGKSTLLLVLKGVLAADRGAVLLGDEVLQGPDPSVGLVLASPEDQGVSPLVEDDVAFGPENLGLPPVKVQARVDRVLRELGLEHLRDTPVHTLSGGQAQKVALASVLAMGARFLLLDEATAMLSPGERDGFLDRVRALAGEGVGVVLVTHDPEELLWAHRVVGLERGKVAYDGPVGAFFAWEGCPWPVPDYEALRRDLAEAGVAVPPWPETSAWVRGAAAG